MVSRLFTAVFAVALLITPRALAEGDFTAEFEVDLSRYGGLWYEHARVPNSFQDNKLERGSDVFSPCYNSTARYEPAGEGRFRVVNSCRRVSESGRIIEEVARGTARVKEGTNNRKLEVAFGPAIARFFQRLFGGSNYWIYRIGPYNAAGLYDWVVVSDPKKEYLWFLTRERFPAEETVQEMVVGARADGLPVDALIYTQRAEESGQVPR